MNSDWIQKRMTNTNEASWGISVIYRERKIEDWTEKHIDERKANRLTGGESVKKLWLAKFDEILRKKEVRKLKHRT